VHMVSMMHAILRIVGGQNLVVQIMSTTGVMAA
jgi:hypothetical protein